MRNESHFGMKNNFLANASSIALWIDVGCFVGWSTTLV